MRNHDTGATGSNAVRAAEWVGSGASDVFVIGVSVLLVLEKLFWMRDCYCVSWSQSKVREEDGAAGEEGKVFFTELEINMAGRGVCAVGVPGKV